MRECILLFVFYCKHLNWANSPGGSKHTFVLDMHFNSTILHLMHFNVSMYRCQSEELCLSMPFIGCLTSLHGCYICAVHISLSSLVVMFNSYISFPPAARSPPGLTKTPLSALGLKPHHQGGSGQLSSIHLYLSKCPILLIIPTLKLLERIKRSNRSYLEAS